MKSTALAAALLGLAAATPLHAADYVIDSSGAHAAIEFRIKHLGYSWLVGRFDRFDGKFSYDEAHPEKAQAEVKIDVKSIDTNHAERDKHLRSDKFFDTDKYPEAAFVSTAYRPDGKGRATLEGKLTLHGVTKPVTIAVEEIGAGPDPWGGYRRGFAGTVKIPLKAFGIDYDLGPASQEADLFLSVEGIRKGAAAGKP